jgi:hypothetical protein
MSPGRRSAKARRNMAKIPWHSNAKFKMEGTKLYIEVELNEDIVEVLEREPGDVYASVARDTPELRINVYVRKR